MSRQNYPLHHYTLTVPHLSKSGVPGALPLVRAGLLERGVTGWTENPGAGVWSGHHEAVTVFTLYLSWLPASGASALLSVGRKAMRDQSAIQVTYHGVISLWEDTLIDPAVEAEARADDYAYRAETSP